MSAAAASAQGSNGGSWQDRLKEHCRAAKLREPLFHIVSDRRGGRTAWSSTVDVAGLNIAARYWYDGQYLNNAREDAAEVALQQLNAQPPPSTNYAGQF